MNRLSPREQMMAAVVVGIVFVIINLALFSSLKGRHAQTATDLATKRTELAALKEILSGDAKSAEREAWITAHQPKLENQSQAGVALLEAVKQVARANDVLLENPELGSAEPKGTHYPVVVLVQTKSSWAGLIAFLNTLQQPDQFIVFENASLQIDSGDPTKMRGHFRIAKWYAP